jgi:hypothetical protein
LRVRPRFRFSNIVRPTAGWRIHLQFDISANTLAIRAVQISKCIVWCAVECTYKSCICNTTHNGSTCYYRNMLSPAILEALHSTREKPWLPIRDVIGAGDLLNISFYSNNDNLDRSWVNSLVIDIISSVLCRRDRTRLLSMIPRIIRVLFVFCVSVWVFSRSFSCLLSQSHGNKLSFFHGCH